MNFIILTQTMYTIRIMSYNLQEFEDYIFFDSLLVTMV